MNIDKAVRTKLLKRLKEKPPAKLPGKPKVPWVVSHRNQRDAIEKRTAELAPTLPVGFEVDTKTFAVMLGKVNRHWVTQSRARMALRERDDFVYNAKKGCYVKI